MARLPIPGSDDGTWGAVLNDYLSQVHNADGSLKSNVVANAQITDGIISEQKLDAALRTKVNITAGTPQLNGDLSGSTDNAVINVGAISTAKLANDAVSTAKIQDNAISEQKLDGSVRTKLNTAPPVSSVSGKAGAVTLVKADVGLSNVDNTSDAQKPVSTAVSLALQGKADSAHAHAISDVTGLNASLGAKADDTQTVHVSGNEVLNGIKTFTASPVVPDPTSDDQAASKAYVDAVASAGGTSDPAVGGDLSGTAGNAQIVAGAVGTNELGAKVVTSAKIADLTITDTQVSATANIAQSKISGLSTTLSAKVDTSDARLTDQRTPTDNSVSTVKLQNNAVSTAKIADGNVTTAKIAANAVDNAKLANSAVTTPKISTTNSPINGQVLTYGAAGLSWSSLTPAPAVLDDLNDVNVTGATDGQSLVYQSGAWIAATVSGGGGGGGVTDHGALTGLGDDDHPQYHTDARGDARYYTQAQVNTFLAGKLDTSDARLSDNRTPIDSSVTTVKIQDGAVGGTKIASAAITPDKLSSDAPVSGEILSYDGTGFAWVAAPTAGAPDPTLGGDLSGTASNAQIVAGAVGANELGAKVVTSAKIADLTITDAQISASANIAMTKVSGLSTALSGKQASSAELTTFAGLVPTNNDVIQRKSGVWVNRTPAQLKTDLALTAGDVGLGNVNNTSDAAKPVSTATQAALDAKANASAVVSLTGDQTVAGVKTFSSSPVVPTPTATTQVATKGYVDGAVGSLSVAGLPSSVMLTALENAGSYVRPTGRTDMRVMFIGSADPGATALTNDIWFKK